MKLIKPSDLTEKEFAPYGTIISIPRNISNKRSGQHWKCWSSIHRFLNLTQFSIGAVEIQNQTKEIIEMERHPNHQELIICGKNTMFLPVAISKNINNPLEVPLKKNVKIFQLTAGEIVVLHKGIWHSACFSSSKNSIYFFGIGINNKTNFKPKMVPLETSLYIDFTS